MSLFRVHSPLSGRKLLPWPLLCWLLLLSLLSGCAGYRQTLDRSDQLARAGDYHQALQQLDDSPLARRNAHRLLYLMERGLLLHLAGDYRQSNQVFEEADRLTEELLTRSLSAEGFSFIVNDNLIPYRGEDYESVYLNYYKALNYLALGELMEAAVEARRVDEKLNWYYDLYQGKNSFREDAFLRLLTGLIYEADGDPGNGLVAYRRSLETYRQQRRLYGVEPPRLLWQLLLRLSRQLGFTDEERRYRAQAPAGVDATSRPGGLLVVLIDRGQIPLKMEGGLLLPTERLEPVRVAIPVLQPRRLLRGQSRIWTAAGGTVTAEPVEDLDAIARRSLEDKKGRILLKQAARIVAKEALVRHSEEEFGPLVGLAARLASILSENADLRSWQLLPGRIEMALVPLPAGSHQVELQLAGASARQTVRIEAGRMAFLHHRFYH